MNKGGSTYLAVMFSEIGSFYKEKQINNNDIGKYFRKLGSVSLALKQTGTDKNVEITLEQDCIKGKKFVIQFF